jgi:hypothetical protein
VCTPPRAPDAATGAEALVLLWAGAMSPGSRTPGGYSPDDCPHEAFRDHQLVTVVTYGRFRRSRASVRCAPIPQVCRRSPTEASDGVSSFIVAASFRSSLQRPISLAAFPPSIAPAPVLQNGNVQAMALEQSLPLMGSSRHVLVRFGGLGSRPSSNFPPKRQSWG